MLNQSLLRLIYTTNGIGWALDWPRHFHQRGIGAQITQPFNDVLQLIRTGMAIDTLAAMMFLFLSATLA